MFWLDPTLGGFEISLFQMKSILQALCIASLLFVATYYPKSSLAHETEGIVPQQDTPCLQLMGSGMYRFTCAQKDGSGYPVWVMPGKSHVLVFLAGQVDASTTWIQPITQRWPGLQVQIIDLVSDCNQLHTNQKIADWLSLQIAKTADGQSYSLSILATRPQFAAMQQFCRNLTGVLYPGGGLKAQRGKLSNSFDVDTDWQYQLEPDGRGAWQLAIFSPQTHLAIIPKLLSLADGESTDGLWPFNRLAYWARQQDHAAYRLFSHQGEIEQSQLQALIHKSIQRQIESATPVQTQALVTHSH